MTRRARQRLTGALAGMAFAALAATPGLANQAQKLIEDSAAMLRAFTSDPELWPHTERHFHRARAVVLAPDVLEAGLFFAGAGGQCLMVVRMPSGGWSAPSFCTVMEASFGLQLGFQKSELLMLVMTDSAVRSLVGGAVKIGGKAGLAVGLVGRSIKGATTTSLGKDIIAVSRNQGFFGGFALDGGWIEPDRNFNQAYYGRAVTAAHILLEARINNLSTLPLRTALYDADQGGRAEYEGDDENNPDLQAMRSGDVVGAGAHSSAADPRAVDQSAKVALRASE